MSDKRLPVVVVHGIGSGNNQDRAHFSLELSNDVHEVTRPVTRVGPYEDVKTANDVSNSNSIIWQEALWECVNNITDRAFEIFAKTVLLNTPVAWFASELFDIISDVPIYLTDEEKGNEIRKVVRDVIKNHPDCIVVGHSLGSVIAADILRAAQIEDNFASIPVSGFVTLGSPLNLLKMRNPMNEEFPFKWYNYYYPKDPIAVRGGLKKSEFPGVINRRLTVGETIIISHGSYWSSMNIAMAVYRLSIKGGKVV